MQYPRNPLNMLQDGMKKFKMLQNKIITFNKMQENSIHFNMLQENMTQKTCSLMIETISTFFRTIGTI